MSEKNEKMGAIWVNKDRKGNKYLSGQIELDRATYDALGAGFELGDTVKMPIVSFKNGYKEEPKHPDWIIFKSKPKEKPRDKPEEHTEIEPF
jgi:hypothetical protein